MKKPLIFLNPLSSTLENLQYSINSIDEPDKNDDSDQQQGKEFEIYNTETLSELFQLLPTVGPSLTFMSSAKKCLLMLKMNKQILKDMDSKVILLTNGKIGPKALTKFIKMGLTEYIQEPVSPKTLMYKVNLLIRSLKTINEVEIEANTNKQTVLIKTKEPEPVTKEEIQRVEKGIILEEKELKERSGTKDVDLDLIPTSNNNEKNNQTPITLDVEIVDEDPLSIDESSFFEDKYNNESNVQMESLDIEFVDEIPVKKVDPELLKEEAIKIDGKYDEIIIPEYENDFDILKDIKIDDDQDVSHDDTLDIEFVDEIPVKKVDPEIVPIQESKSNRPQNVELLEEEVIKTDEKYDEIITPEYENDFDMLKDIKIDDDQDVNHDDILDIEFVDQTSVKAKDSIVDIEQFETNKNSELDIDNLNDDIVHGQTLDYAAEIQKRKKTSMEDLYLDEKKRKKVDPLSIEHITSYYGIKKKELLPEPDSKKDKNKNNILEFELDKPKKRNVDISINFANETNDLGTQTIDYRKLKKEFDSIDETMELEKDINTTQTKDDSAEEQTDDKQIYEPNAGGLESIIKIANLYIDDQTAETEIFHQIAKTIHDQEAGLVTFFTHDEQTQTFSEEFTGHVEFGNMSSKTERIIEWKSIKLKGYENWKQMSLPSWSDETFQETKIDFFYPFFEGTNNMGFAIVHFSKGIYEENTSKIEILLESARGIYLTKFHASGAESHYQQHKNKTTNTDGGGIFSRFFKRKTG